MRMQPTALVAVLLSGCGGASFGENSAGSDGWLDHQGVPTQESTAIANDGRCAWTGNPFVGETRERVYALLYETDQGDCHELTTTPPDVKKSVYGLEADEAAASCLIDVSGHDDVRLLDAGGGLLLMGEVDGNEQLYRIDHDSLAVLNQRSTRARYWGTRTSPSRRFVAVGDNSEDNRLPIDVIDPITLDTVEVDAGADWAEAMWMTEREALAGVLYDQDAGTRLLLWDFADGLVATSSNPRMPDPTWDVPLPETLPSLFVGPTWIGIDPLDRYAVFPLLDLAFEPILSVFDVRDGSVRTVQGARGPVAFTPDGATIVAWDVREDARALVLVDPVTLAFERLELPGDGIPTYFVSHDGNEVVVADTNAEEQLVLVDLATGAQTVLEASLHLDNFTSRLGQDEIWLVDEGLWRLDLADAVVEPIPLDFVPNHVVWMPTSDLLYLDDTLRPRMVLWDPVAREVRTEARLDTARRGLPRLSLAR